MSPVELALVAVAAMLALAAVVNGLDLWLRRRSIRSAVPTRVLPLPGPIPTAEEARRWRLQAVDEEHAFWDERFRAAGGVPPLRQADRERLTQATSMYGGVDLDGAHDRMPLFGGGYAGSNSAFFWSPSPNRPWSINEMRERFAQHRPARTDWRTPLRDLVDPR